MDSEVENQQFEIKAALYQFTADELIQICDSLTLSGENQENVKGKTRNTIASLIIKHIERSELRDLEDEGMSELLCIMDIIKTLQQSREKKVETPNPEIEEQQRLRREIEQLKLEVQRKETEMREKTNKIKMDMTVDNDNVPVYSSNVHSNTMQWRKDFKISGQIGEPGQKDRLTFSSLAHQIENGLSKGYPEADIVDAVVRAIVPSLQLRSYLEGKSDLSLPTLRRILRSHYQERSATELYRQLTTEVQSHKETPQNFLIRAMDLRQKILFASQEAESSLKYDPALVQSLFMHTVLTGLQNDNIKTDLQPYLLQTSTADELLLERLNISCANEKERQDKKRQTASRQTTVHSVQSSDTTEKDKKCPPRPSPATVPPDVLSDLKEIKADMVLLKDLKAEMSQIRESMYKTDNPPSLYPGTSNTTECVNHPPYLQPQHTEQRWSNERAAVGHLPGEREQRYHSTHNQRFIAGPAQFQQGFAPQRYPEPRPRPRCSGCRERGEEYCQHCYRCGSSEHYRAGCRGYISSNTTKDKPLNGERLPPRDRE